MSVIKDLVEIGKQLNQVSESQVKLIRRYDGLHVSWYNNNEGVKTSLKEIQRRLDELEQVLRELRVLPRKRWWR